MALEILTVSETKFLQLMGLYASGGERYDTKKAKKDIIKYLMVINAMKSNKAENRE